MAYSETSGRPSIARALAHPETPVTGPHALRWALAFLLGALSAFRLWYAGGHGLVCDEAYYWLWARHLATGYYDQGPGVALTIRFGLLFGTSTACVRLGAAVCGIVVSVIGYALASRIFHSEAAGLGAAIMLNAVPLLFVGGILITHDSPQMATWALATYCLARACGIGDPRADDSGRARPVWWLMSGILGGLSMDCKYTAVLFFPTCLLFLLMSPTSRRQLRTPWPYLSVALGVLLFIPPVLWNAGHDWAAVRHILNLGGAHQRRLFDSGSVGDYLGGQLAVTMLFFFPLAWASITAWRRGRRMHDDGLVLAACFSWPIWALFFLLSLHGQVEANWPVPAYFTAAVVTPRLAYQGLIDSHGVKRQLLRSFYTLSVVLVIVAIVVALFPETLLLLPNGPQAAKHLQRQDRTNEMYGWRQLAGAIGDARLSTGGPWKVSAIRYQDAAELSFNLPGQEFVYDLPVRRRHNQYDYWPPMPPGSNSIVVIPLKDMATSIAQIQQLFNHVTRVRNVRLWRKPLYEDPIARYVLLRATGYHGGRSGILLNQW